MSPAAKKWTVYRRGEALGTFTAAEIREQLRQGILSPGDFAAAEGSPVQQEIIEIDAIFGPQDESAALLSGAPRRSRWAKRAEEMNLDGAAPTRARPDRLRPGAGMRPPRARVRPEGSPPGNASDTVLTTLIALMAGALAAIVFWLLRNRN